MQAEGLARRVVILDCDVHQGNGTAAILRADPTIFTFSIHGARNFPFHKEPGDLDIALEDGTGDDAYLAALAEGAAGANPGRGRPGHLPGRAPTHLPGIRWGGWPSAKPVWPPATGW